MRTTIEITDEQRAELARIAHQRGEKGFSAVVRDAVDFYLRHQGARREAIEAALAARGSLDEAEVASLEEHARRVREQWR